MRPSRCERHLRALIHHRPRRSMWANVWSRHPSFNITVRMAPWGAVFALPVALTACISAHASPAFMWIVWIGPAWFGMLAAWMIAALAAYRWVVRRSVCLWDSYDVTEVMRTVHQSEVLRAYALQWLDASGDAALSAHELALLRRAAQCMGLEPGAPDFSYRSYRHDVKLDGEFYRCFPNAPSFGHGESDNRQDFAASVAASDLAMGHVARARCRARAQVLDRMYVPAEDHPRTRTRL